MKGISRSRATLIFSMGVPIIIAKPRWVLEVRFPPVRQAIPGGTDAIHCYAYGDHNGNV